MQTDYGNKSYTTLSFFQIWLGIAIGLTITVLLIDGSTGTSLFGYVIAIFFLLTLLLIFRIVQLIYDRLERRKYDYQQIEALHSLYHHLGPGVQLPQMRNHAGSPDFLNLIIEVLDRHQPKVIVEASSGVSSMVISEWLLKHQSNAQHFALENEAFYADLTRQRIRNPHSEIIWAPLKSYSIGGKTFEWYDLEQLKLDKPIDLLVVDGPPQPLQEHARFPALPLLADQLSPNAVLVLDDAIRQSEREIVTLWEKEFHFDKQYRYVEKGAFILQLTPNQGDANNA